MPTRETETPRREEQPINPFVALRAAVAAVPDQPGTGTAWMAHEWLPSTPQNIVHMAPEPVPTAAQVAAELARLKGRA